MLNFSPSFLFSVASILARTTDDCSSLSFLAAFEYYGASFLQCPHHGA